MARSPKPTQGGAHPAGPTPLPYTAILDEFGTFLFAFDEAVRPLSVAQLPPPLLGEARLIVSEGLLPPRATIVRPGQLGPVLAVAGDSTYWVSAPARGVDEAALRRAFGGALAFEAAFKAHLTPFDGNRAALASAPAVLLRAFASSAKAPLPAHPGIFVHPVVDASAPGVFVALKIRNAGSEPVPNVAVRFASHKDYLLPSALYGDAAVLEGSVIRLEGPLRPGVKTLELRLEPQQPMSAPLHVEIVQNAPRGERRTTVARPVRLSVAFPGLAAPMVVRPKEVRAFLASHNLARDVWRIRFSKTVTPAFAFERAQEAVMRERPATLLDFSSQQPLFFESWHLGQVKGTDRFAIVEVAVRGELRLIEFRAATERPADLLGIKAEYRRRMHELLSERFMGRKPEVLTTTAVAGDDARDVPQLHSTLLMRHLEGELAAGDLRLELERTASGGGGEGWELVSGIFAGGGAGDAAGSKRAPRPPRPTRLAAASSSGEFDSQLLDGFTRYLAPHVLVQTAHMGRVGPRRRPGMDRGAEAEAAADDAET